MKIDLTKKDWRLILEALERTQTTATSDPERLEELIAKLQEMLG
jgi:hypothetical protein